MEDADLNLSLNLNLTSTGTYSEKKKQKVFGNRSQRIKQRKVLKHQKQTTGRDEEAKETSAKAQRKRQATDDHAENQTLSPTPHKRARKEARRFGEAPQGPKKTDKGVISSLFRRNPDIPEVKSQKVRAVKEAVFASTKFSDLPLHPHLVGTVEEKLQLVTLTRVQQLSIPVILQQKDVLIKSQTGSGKTLAYALPIVHTLASLPRPIDRTMGPFALIIVPTRELAIQSYETFSKLLQSAVWIVAGCLMGGEKRKTEKARIRKGLNILVSTPGRLLDHLKHTTSLSLHRVRWLVIDEADRLLELGYEKDIAQIVTLLNQQSQEHRQTILLSATLSAGVERLSGMTLTDHQSIDASAEPSSDAGGDSSATERLSGDGDGGDPKSSFALPEKLRQFFAVVPCKLRLVTLAAFVLWKCKLQPRRSKMVVFLNTQHAVQFHHHLFSLVFNPHAHHGRDLDGQVTQGRVTQGHVTQGQVTQGRVTQGHLRGKEEGVDLFQLHGDMLQKDRTRVFQEFSEAASGVLLCTDVASRGLHLPHVDWIVQYSSPGATVDYIHRVGRTARAGKQGNAILFLMPSETDYIAQLNKQHISVTEMVMKDILMNLLSAIRDLPHLHLDSKRQLPRTYEEASTFMQDRFEERVLKNAHLRTLATKGYQSFVRAYATYPSGLKEIFSLKDLHLGHVAKAFALREAPSHLKSSAARAGGKGHRLEGKSWLKLKSKKKGFSQVKKKRPLSATISEFGANFDSNKGMLPKFSAI